VWDYRIYELSKWDEPHHPPERPPYIHILAPCRDNKLNLMIRVLQRSSCRRYGGKLISKFGNEINVLIHTPLEEIEVVESQSFQGVKQFTNNTLT